MEAPDSLDQLYREYAPPLFRFLIRLTGDESETREVLQEIFIRLARSPRLLDGVEVPLSYLFRVAHRLVIDRHRQDHARRKYDHLAHTEENPVLAPEPPPIDDTWRMQILAQSLKELPPEQRAVLALRVWEDMTFVQIAEVLDISPNTAASRYRYALDKLRDQLRPLHRDLSP